MKRSKALRQEDYTQGIGVTAGLTSSMNDSDVEEERQQRQNDEEYKDCDPPGQSHTSLDLAVVQVVDDGLRHWDDHCDYCQHNHRLL